MSQLKVDIDTLKKAAFVHDLGKLLNWAYWLHYLDGARVLEHLGFADTVIGVALYHHGPEKDVKDKNGEWRPWKEVIKSWIQSGSTDCAHLKSYDKYNEYCLVLSELVDKLMAGFDRMGKPQRPRPIVLRNPLTHLPMNGALRQFEATDKRANDAGPDSDYLREFVSGCYLPGASLKPLDVDQSKSVYQLDDSLTDAPLLQVMADNKDIPFNHLYRILYNHPVWQTLTRQLIPQGHHPPTDTLALWYHLQFSSALAGLYWAEKFREAKQVEDEHKRLRKRPLKVKIGLLYIHIAGLTEYFAGAYRLPDFSGTQEIADALKRSIKERLLGARRDGDPIIWEDSFLYEGHDDFLVMVPVERITDGQGKDVDDYIYPVDEEDPFLAVVEQALSNSEVIEQAVNELLHADKPRAILGCEPGDGQVFGDGQRLCDALSSLVEVKWALRSFARFKDGNDLTPLFGVMWNRLRAEARGRLPQPMIDVQGYAGDICDCCRVNLAGHDPNPNNPRDWIRVDWDRQIVKDEDWGDRPLHYWIFRGTDDPRRGEGDKLCHVCLLRRMLGHGTSLEKIAPEEEEEARIAVIKGNVNRTLWYIGGSLAATSPLKNEDSVYSRVWHEEIANPISERSSKGNGSADKALERLENQARRASEHSRAGQIDVDTTQELLNTWETLRQAYPNPWSPYPLSPRELDDLVPWFFSGTPHFIEDNEDLPTPSRTMTVSSLISEAVREVTPVVETEVDPRARPVVHVGGDEFLVICRAGDAPHLARCIFRRVVAHLNSVPEDQVEELSDFLPVTLAMGMVTAKRKHPMYGLLKLVDRLMRSAKKTHPNGNAIDFANVVGGVDEAYLSRERFTEEWLSERPLTLSQFGSLVDDVEQLRKSDFPGRQLHQIAALTSDVPLPRTDRRTAALAYAWQPHDGKHWETVRKHCAEGTFQDLMTLWRWPQREEESEDAETDG